MRFYYNSVLILISLNTIKGLSLKSLEAALWQLKETENSAKDLTNMVRNDDKLAEIINQWRIGGFKPENSPFVQEKDVPGEFEKEGGFLQFRNYISKEFRYHPYNIIEPKPNKYKQEWIHTVDGVKTALKNARINNRDDDSQKSKWIKYHWLSQEDFLDHLSLATYEKPTMRPPLTKDEKLIFILSAEYPGNKELRAARSNIMRIDAPGPAAASKKNYFEPALERLKTNSINLHVWQKLDHLTIQDIDDKLEEILVKMEKLDLLSNYYKRYNLDAESVLDWYFYHPYELPFAEAAFNILTDTSGTYKNLEIVENETPVVGG